MRNLILIGFLCVTLSAFSEYPRESERGQIKAGGNPAEFLFSYQDARNVRIARAAVLKEHRIAIEKAKKDTTLHQMYSELLGRKAITQEEYQRVLLKRDVSNARVTMREHEAAFLKAAQDKYELFMKYAQGTAFDLDETYQVLLRYWNSQCDFFRAQVTESEAELRYADYKVKISRDLHNKNRTIPLEDLLEDELGRVDADENLKTRRSLADNCNADVPTLDYLKSLGGDDKEKANAR